MVGATGQAAADLPEPAPGGRYVHAQVAAIEQPIFYNRFGSFNPYGMIYALLGDLVIEQTSDGSAEDDKLQPAVKYVPSVGGHPVPEGGDVQRAVLRPHLHKALKPDEEGDIDARQVVGKVRLRDDKRPRPLVLRGNVGDILIVEFYNLLPPVQPDLDRCRDVAPYTTLQARRLAHDCDWTGEYSELQDEAADEAATDRTVNGDWPLTRTASIASPGLEAVRCDGGAGAPDDKATGMRPIRPGEHTSYCFRLTREGTFLFSSLGAPAGGQGDGGSLSHGLFGAVNVQPRGSEWYRSQVTEADLAEARKGVGPPALLDFQRRYPGSSRRGWPVLAIAAPAKIPWPPTGADRRRMPDEAVRGESSPPSADADRRPAIGEAGPGEAAPASTDADRKRAIPKGALRRQTVLELMHGDLTAIVDRCPRLTQGIDDGTCAFKEAPAVRDFTIVFHDELKTLYPNALKELESEENAFPKLGIEPGLGGGLNPLAGVRDGFAINYGSSGMGSILLANRKGFGPAKDCLECAYEEFFLQSWVNGDPALLHEYADDPSNVYHSYLGDPVVFHNTHAGPKETHVFHLHAHQWLASRSDPGAAAPDGIRRELGTYLDSQTIAPMQGFTYEIYHGGSGNLNSTVGDSIFHCHLYPHFAQGMWSLWRVHDVFEDGSRRLPDAALPAGTPIPAIVPLPGKALAPMPTAELPGYPFYIAGKTGHRAPQAPNDIAKDNSGEPLDGGLPRHIITDGSRSVSGVPAAELVGADPDDVVRHALLTGDFTADLETAKVEVLPAEGSASERMAMEFHAAKATGLTIPLSGNAMECWPKASGGGCLGLPPPLPPSSDPVADWKARTPGYESITPDGRTREADGISPVIFRVNGSTGKPGAPYADPCRDIGGDRINWEPTPRTTRYEVSAIERDLVVNSKGWHDPQGRINVLSEEAEIGIENPKPFFFRAHSGDCIEFRHTNRLPKLLERDDFQVKTPTDTVGQHIHLVKFDVTSSDGSGNGFNYEDGTFAKEAIRERLEAAWAWLQAGQALDDVTRTVVEEACEPQPDAMGHHCRADYQTTTQRWYAEPLLTWADDGNGRESKADRTLRTVFTHDHFGPSSIQQHGFYSALLIEPKGSIWYESRLANGSPQPMQIGKADGTQAIIARIAPEDQPLYGQSFREFALAVADFALLYHRRDDLPVAECAGVSDSDAQGLAGVCRDLNIASGAAPDKFPFLDPARLAALRAEIDSSRNDRGRPVAEPARPESISKDHHDPYLVNYANEPLPLRLADESNQPKAGMAGDLAFVFSSQVHEDPGTEIFEAYENERVQMRLIQGAQEVQHVAQIQGLRWRREAGDRTAPYVAAQEIGISEHFELGVDRLPTLSEAKPIDHLYSAGSVDALWNGAWGLIRVHNRPGDGPAQPPSVQLSRLALVAEASQHWSKALGMALDVAKATPTYLDPGASDDERLIALTQALGSREKEIGFPATVMAARVHALVKRKLTERSPLTPEALAALTEAAIEGVVSSLSSQAVADSVGLDLMIAQTTGAKIDVEELRGVLPLGVGANLMAAAASINALADGGREPDKSNGRQLAETHGLLTQHVRITDRNADKVKAGPDRPLTCNDNKPNVRFFVEAWSVRDWLGSPPGAAGAEYGRRLHDTAALAYRLIYTDRGLVGEKLDQARQGNATLRKRIISHRVEAREADRLRGYVPPLVLRANAGECIQVVLTNCLAGEEDANAEDSRCRESGQVPDDHLSDRNTRVPDGGDRGMLPRITPLNALEIQPSTYVDIKPQLVTWDVVAADGIPVGNNGVEPVRLGETSDRFIWYAGVVKTVECHLNEEHRDIQGNYFWPCDRPFARHGQVSKKYHYEFRPVPFGAIPLTSFADVVEHGSQGLVGTLVVEPEGSRHLDVESGRRLDDPDPATGAALATLRNGGAEAIIKWREANGIWAMPRHEFVLTYQDGMGLRFDPAWDPRKPVPDCRVCDDSYDLGETGVSARSEPFWMRLGLDKPIDEDRNEAWNLNRVVFPPTFFPSALDGSRPTATPTLRAKAGELLSFRVTHAAGRARQRAFVVYGHDYPDLMPRHGSAGSALVAPGKAVNAHVCDLWGEPRLTDYGYETRVCAAGGAHIGRWLWRDGPAQHVSGGSWGGLIIE